MVFFHLQEPLNFFIDNFQNVLRYNFTFKLFQKGFNLLLLLVLFVCEVFFERLVNLFQLFLSLYLIALKVVLLLKFLPDLNLINEVGEDIASAFKLCKQGVAFVNFLEVVLFRVDKETVSVYVLRQTNASQQHVHELLNFSYVEVALQKLQVS